MYGMYFAILLFLAGILSTKSHQRSIRGLPRKGAVVDRIPVWHKQWRVSVDLMPLKKAPCWTNVYHFTTGGDTGIDGFRIPGIWFLAHSFKMEIRTWIDRTDFVYFTKTDLPTNEMSTITLEQIQDDSEQGKFFYKIYVNNALLLRVENKHPEVYRNVIVYKSDPWYSAANAIIKNFNYYSIPSFPTVDLLQRSSLVDTLPKWYTQWRITFDIKPLKKTAGYSNIAHFTIDGDCCKKGDRIPAISFLPNSFRLYITQINEQGTFQYKQTTDLPDYKFSSVRVEQTKNKGKFYFSVFINGRLAYWRINYYPAMYENVKVYKSNPWTDPANAIVNNFDYETFDEPVLRKNVVATTIPVWRKQWMVDFTVKPYKRENVLTNIVHFTTGGDCCEEGQRVPGVWFLPNSFRMLVVSSLSGNGYVTYISRPLPANQFTVVRIMQSRVCDGTYLFNVAIDGKIAFETTSKSAKVYENVTAYTSDPWHRQANTAFKGFYFFTMP